MIRCQFVFFDAGGGHRSAANALRYVMEQESDYWNVQMVNLQEVLDPCDVFRKFTGVRSQDLYNRMLRSDWTITAPPLNRIFHASLRLYRARIASMLEGFWQRNLPDLVVSLVPHFNGTMLQALRRVSRITPFVTIMTDLADYPPHFWLERQEQIFICGTRKAVDQALGMGIPEECILRTSGMIIHPRFYDPIAVDRATERARHGLVPDLPTGLVMFGGHGSDAMLEIARNLERSATALQLILVCGHNHALQEELGRRGGRNPQLVLGFTTDVPYYMRLSDFFIGKPGPGSISEALAMGLPVIVERNLKTLPQERYNATWVRERGVGLVVRNFQDLSQSVARLLEPGVLPACRARAAALENRAVFEIPRMLRRLVENPQSRSAPSSRLPLHQAI
jgi:1,2-diacylglycerol 3-beta-galactosyltransferase